MGQRKPEQEFGARSHSKALYSSTAASPPGVMGASRLFYSRDVHKDVDSPRNAHEQRLPATLVQGLKSRSECESQWHSAVLSSSAGLQPGAPVFDGREITPKLSGVLHTSPSWRVKTSPGANAAQLRGILLGAEDFRLCLELVTRPRDSAQTGTGVLPTSHFVSRSMLSSEHIEYVVLRGH